MESGFKILMRLEQKNNAWIKDIVQKLKKPGNLAVVVSAGIFSVTKACIRFPKRRRFIGCTLGPSCMTKTKSLLIRHYARLLFSKEAEIDGRKKFAVLPIYMSEQCIQLSCESVWTSELF